MMEVTFMSTPRPFPSPPSVLRPVHPPGNQGQCVGGSRQWGSCQEGIGPCEGLARYDGPLPRSNEWLGLLKVLTVS